MLKMLVCFFFLAKIKKCKESVKKIIIVIELEIEMFFRKRRKNLLKKHFEVLLLIKNPLINDVFHTHTPSPASFI